MATAAPITGAPTRAPSIDRRHLFGSLALLPALALAPAAIAASGLTPFRIAEARYHASVARFDALPEHLEHTDPARFEAEESLLHEVTRNALDTPAGNLQEFALSFLIALDDGHSMPCEAVIDRLVADAKRLTGAA